MIAYFDTSALVPLTIAEATSATAARLWTAASRVVSVRLVYPEARAALAQAHRLRRISRAQLRKAVDSLEGYCAEIDVVEIDATLAREAGSLAERHALRGYDAVHLAAAQRLNDDELVFVAGDGSLLAAAGSAGLRVAAIG